MNKMINYKINKNINPLKDDQIIANEIDIILLEVEDYMIYTESTNLPSISKADKVLDVQKLIAKYEGLNKTGNEKKYCS